MKTVFILPMLRAGLIGCTFWLVGMGMVGESRAQNLQSLRKEEPFRIKGTLSAGMWLYSTSGISSRRQPFSWYLSGSPVLSIYGISFPFTLTVSEQERRFAQPFNRYGVSPYYKWLTIHAGYRNVKFSDFTLAGVSMLGGGFEMNPGKLRLGVMVGRINRAVAEDTVLADGTPYSTYPVYKRMGYAFKIGFGKPASYVDLSFFKGYDDYRSITRPTRNTRVTPMDNAVVGLKAHTKLGKHLTFDADAALSALTRNLYARSLDSSTLGTQLSFLKRAPTILEVNSSTGLYKAIRASLSYGFTRGNVAARYERIDQDFQSLGSFFFNTDNEQWTLSPSFSFLENTISISGSYGVARDNLNGKKYATTMRSIGSLNLGLQLSNELNVGLNLSNFGTNQNRGVGELFNDTTAISIVNSSYAINASYNKSDQYQSHSANFSAGYQDAKDQNRFTRDLTSISSFYSNLSYTLTAVEEQSSASLSLMYNNTLTPTQRIVTMGPSLSIGIPFFDKALRPTLSAAYYLRRTDGQADGSTLSLNGNVSYTLDKQTLSVGGTLLRNVSNTTLTPSFSELRLNVTYGYSF